MDFIWFYHHVPIKLAIIRWKSQGQYPFKHIHGGRLRLPFGRQLHPVNFSSLHRSCLEKKTKQVVWRVPDVLNLRCDWYHLVFRRASTIWVENGVSKKLGFIWVYFIFPIPCFQTDSHIILYILASPVYIHYISAVSASLVVIQLSCRFNASFANTHSYHFISYSSLDNVHECAHVCTCIYIYMYI